MKKLMMSFVLLFAMAGMAQTNSGAKFKGFVKVRPERELYVDYVRAQKNKPTVVLLNGMTYSTQQFEKLAAQLTARGIGVLRFDFDGMGKTLLKYAPSLAAYPYEQQVKDLKILLGRLQIPTPYNFVGLSYGGGIQAAYALKYPKDVLNHIMIAPYTEPVEAQDKWIRSQIWVTRQMFPKNKSSDDELYDYFLHQIVYATYPQAEPIVLENPFKLEATYNLARGIRKFKAIDQTQGLAGQRVHLMMAGMDQYVPAHILNNYWDKVPRASKMSRLIIQGVEHKIPEVVPNFTAAWIFEILKDNPLLKKGLDFEGSPLAGTARSGTVVIPLSKD